MGLFSRKPRRGSVWTGPAAYVDANEAAILGVLPGHYALSEDGKGLLRVRRRPVRLVAIDDAPGNPNDGRWHREVAGKGDPIARAGDIVPFEFSGQGRAEVKS